MDSSLPSRDRKGAVLTCIGLDLRLAWESIAVVKDGYRIARGTGAVIWRWAADANSPRTAASRR